jgi:hypothetical protein
MLSPADRRALLAPGLVRRCLRAGVLPALVFFAVTVAILSLAGFTLVEILRDPAQITGESSLLGFESNVGNFLWIAAAAICLFRHASYDLPPDRVRRLLALCGWFSLWLGIDDFFMIHDRYVAEGLIIPLDALFVVYLLVRHRDTILRVDGFAFVLAGAFLGMSVAVDAVQEILPISYGVSQLLEEGFKFLGAATWLYFCCRLAAFRPGQAGDEGAAGLTR